MKKGKLVFFLFFALLSCNIFSQKSNLQLPKLSKGDEKICHQAYCFVYSEKHEQAKWIAYELTKNMLDSKVKRNDKFKVDPLVESGTANSSDYKGSGFDRGHLAPSADMCFSNQTMEESFYYSNMSPQNPGFNRGIWKNLESEVREYAEKLNKIYIVTGPILSDNLEEIGENNVDIPEFYYKAILYISDTNSQCIAFVLPNKKSSNSIYQYCISVDKLEKQTGINFFHNLPFFLEKKLEKKIDIEFWQNIIKD